MPFRSKLKKAFGRSSSVSEGPGTPASANHAGGDTPAEGNHAATAAATTKKEKPAKKHRWGQKSKEWDNWPEHLYKPHEVPQPKYKRPPAKEHTKNLEKYTWDADAHEDDRRASATSQYSPMGSKLQSRRSSGIGPDGEVIPEGISTAGSPIHGVDPLAAGAEEGEDEDWPLARVDTVKPAAPRPAPSNAAPAVPSAAAAGAEASGDTFDTADLTRALTAIKDGHKATTATAPVGA